MPNPEVSVVALNAPHPNLAAANAVKSTGEAIASFGLTLMAAALIIVMHDFSRRPAADGPWTPNAIALLCGGAILTLVTAFLAGYRRQKLRSSGTFRGCFCAGLVTAAASAALLALGLGAAMSLPSMLVVFWGSGGFVALITGCLMQLDAKRLLQPTDDGVTDTSLPQVRLVKSLQPAVTRRRSPAFHLGLAVLALGLMMAFLGLADASFAASPTGGDERAEPWVQLSLMTGLLAAGMGTIGCSLWLQAGNRPPLVVRCGVALLSAGLGLASVAMAACMFIVQPPDVQQFCCVLLIVAGARIALMSRTYPSPD